MATLVSKNFNVNLAQQFKESFTESDPTQYYLFYARVNPWPVETSPPSFSDNIKFTDYDIWRGMLSLKKVSNNNVTMAVSKYTWTTNTVYTKYTDDNASLSTSQFYVITSNNNVYKCLDNSNSAPSTVSPTGQTTSIISTSDGYRWKFMYSISQADINRFAGGEFIPVKTLATDDGSPQWDVQQAAANGAINIVQVTDGGSGYLENKGTVAAVTSTTQLTIANTGFGSDNAYTGSTIFISSGLGAGQVRIITAYNAATKLITVNTAFGVSPNTSSTYHIGPRINMIGDGVDATAYANVQSGAITKITTVNPGSNYSLVNVGISANPSYGSGATAVAYLPPFGGHGSDPVRELFATNVTLNVEVVGSEQGFFAANNQFRVYGLMKDPIIKATGGVASSLRYDQTLRLTANAVSGIYSQDEFVIGSTSGARGRVVYFANSNVSGTKGVIHLTNVSGSFSNTETLTGNTSSVTAQLRGITQPDLLQYTGSMLYAVTQEPIERDADQTENFTITARF